MIRLLLAAVLSLAVHALFLQIELPPGRPAAARIIPQPVTIRLLAPPLPKPPPKLPVPPAPIRPPEPPRPPEPVKATPPRPSAPAPQPDPAPRSEPPLVEDRTAEQIEPVPEAPAPQPPPEDAAPPNAPSAAPAIQEPPVRLSVPRYDINPPIVYPAPARRRNLQGTVILEVYVTPDGRVAEVKVARSSGHAVLDNSALKAVRKWRFEPALQGQRPIAMWVQVPVKYALE